VWTDFMYTFFFAHQVCTGSTGHAEVVQVEYDPDTVTYPTLLRAFFKLHDPTTLNRQGADVGTQYRSMIAYHSPAQKDLAEAAMRDAQANFTSPIVTEIVPASVFYPAEDYHQDYFTNNPDQPYCSAVVGPKVKKFRAEFRDLLKQD